MKFLVTKLKNLIAWLKLRRRNRVFFVLALPTLFGIYLGLVFLSALTGISEYLPYRKVKDSDKHLAAAVEENVIYLDQGWKERYRNRYYFTPQGSNILPLDIALALEMPKSDQLIFGPRGAVTERFGYLPYS